MISVKEAKEIIRLHAASLGAVTISLKNAAGLTLAADVPAKYDIPCYEQSSMDGYAFLFDEIKNPLTINGEIAAGTTNRYKLFAKEAARIFTGAPLPSGADTVAMQEKVLLENGKVFIKDEHLKKGDYVRPIGSEIRCGDLALQKNVNLSPPAIGFLAGIGIAEVTVYPAPSVCIIITGDELQQPGKPLLFGQVYESNSISLSSALNYAGINTINIFYANDKLTTVKSVLQKALENNDVILLTGGISVGDYDFVLNATEMCGIEKQFHKIKQRPGKPLYFGTKENKLIFGLPGNPASVLTCFYEYVLPALEKIMQKKNSVSAIKAFMQSEYKKNPGFTHFLKGMYEDKKVNILGAQASFQLNSFANANCLIVIEEEVTDIKKGETVEVHLFPV